MGRRENPIAPCDRELEKLVRYLRDHREKAKLTYKELAARSKPSASTLIRAASGEQMPRLETVRAYAVACGADPGEAERLWKRARYRAVRSDEVDAPHPRYVRDFAALHVALVDLYQKDGARPPRELEDASEGVLAHATVERFLRQEGGRPSREFVRAFASVCGAKGLALRDWEQAWDRAEERRLGVRRAVGLPGITSDGRKIYFHLVPERTPDGQEIRQIKAFPIESLANGHVISHLLQIIEMAKGGRGVLTDTRASLRMRQPAQPQQPTGRAPVAALTADVSKPGAARGPGKTLSNPARNGPGVGHRSRGSVPAATQHS
ncbi:helix-turn-helix domain-containing protein [Streptomyces ipomoeae]|uniref:helix-turn-helix domain-containing protein n=1 Tax=Streptomyces ipomoeae TaxID=103232 RepID=UPI0029B831A0|nr:helix-turn-helix transcriptional regulator [Streptomyces ipomoeae]MDX2692164.1 helix-turn-helix transcriptional regulator [Streptomyces ipomoeae]MDX2840503.1 helix-turn-helix transcriptional regulator [Streptomyces ipomoeae]